MIQQEDKYTAKQRALYSNEELDTLKLAFDKCDLDKSGEISKEELMAICEAANYEVNEGSLDFIFNVIFILVNGVDY